MVAHVNLGLMTKRNGPPVPLPLEILVFADRILCFDGNPNRPTRRGGNFPVDRDMMGPAQATTGQRAPEGPGDGVRGRMQTPLDDPDIEQPAVFNPEIRMVIGGDAGRGRSDQTLDKHDADSLGSSKDRLPSVDGAPPVIQG